MFSAQQLPGIREELCDRKKHSPLATNWSSALALALAPRCEPSRTLPRHTSPHKPRTVLFQRPLKLPRESGDKLNICRLGRFQRNDCRPASASKHPTHNHRPFSRTASLVLCSTSVRLRYSSSRDCALQPLPWVETDKSSSSNAYPCFSWP